MEINDEPDSNGQEGKIQQKQPYVVPTLVATIIDSMTNENRIELMMQILKLSGIVGLQLTDCSGFDAPDNNGKIILTSKMRLDLREEDCTSYFAYGHVVKYLLNARNKSTSIVITKELLIKARNILINVMTKARGVDRNGPINIIYREPNRQGEWCHCETRRIILTWILIGSPRCLFIISHEPDEDEENPDIDDITLWDILTNEEHYNRYLSYWES